MSKQESKFFDAVRKMPLLSHYPDRNQVFDIRNSEVAQWICQQPETLEYLMNVAVGKKLIRFHKETAKWRGIHDGAVQWTGNNKSMVIRFIEHSGATVKRLAHMDKVLAIETENEITSITKSEWLVVGSHDPVTFKVVPDEEHKNAEGDAV